MDREAVRQGRGPDGRRGSWSPTDLARAESLLEQHGGALTPYVGLHGAGVTLEWMDRHGAYVVVRGNDLPTTLGQLSARLSAPQHDT
jgi:hypothetical protein